MNPTILLIVSFTCIAVGLFMLFWHNRSESRAISPHETSTDDFASDMLTALSEYYPDVPFNYDSKTDMITPSDHYEGDHQFRFFLGNLRNRTLDMGTEDRTAFIREFILSVTDSSEVTEEELKANLFLRARTPSELLMREILLNDQREKPSTVGAVQRGDLILETVLNLPLGVSMVDIETLAEHKFDLDKSINMAANNLLRVTPEKSEDIWERVDNDIWISKLNDDFDAARLISFPEEMRMPFEGPVTAFVPSHSIALITNSSDDEVLGKMVQFGISASATHRGLSRALYQQTDTGWKRLKSTDRNSAIGLADLDETLAAYGNQKEILDQVLERNEKDIFVPTIMTVTMKDESAPPQMLAVFLGHDTYLPEVDYIIPAFEDLSKEEGHTNVVDWDTFSDIVGLDNIPPVKGVKPIRYDFTEDIGDTKKTKLTEAAKPLPSE